MTIPTFVAVALLLLVVPLLLLLLWAAMKGGWKRFMAHLSIYVIDMGMAITGFIMGFGLTVQNWWWVIGPMVVGRFCFHILHSASKEAK